MSDVSAHQLRALFMYWCHVCWLRFQRDNLVVDGRQMVSLVSVKSFTLSFVAYRYLISLESSYEYASTCYLGYV